MVTGVMTYIRCRCNMVPRIQARAGHVNVNASVQQQWIRGMASKGRIVAVLGAAGGIGQPLGLLMKLNPLVSDLRLFNIAGTPGVACDISHVNTQAIVRLGPKGAEEVMGLGELSNYKKKGLEAMKKELLDSIKKGVDFVKG